MKRIKEILLIMLLGTITCGASGQGSWNIGYIEIDSITTAQIGQSLKIDFKHIKGETKRKSKWVRFYVTPQDTGTISLDGEEIKLIEIRKIYDDQGSFKEQYLEIIDQDKLVIKRIYETKLIDITSDSLKFSAIIDSYDKHSTEPYRKINSTLIEFWINKKSLDGLMKEINVK